MNCVVPRGNQLLSGNNSWSEIPEARKNRHTITVTGGWCQNRAQSGCSAPALWSQAALSLRPGPLQVTPATLEGRWSTSQSKAQSRQLRGLCGGHPHIPWRIRRESKRIWRPEETLAINYFNTSFCSWAGLSPGKWSKKLTQEHRTYEKTPSIPVFFFFFFEKILKHTGKLGRNSPIPNSWILSWTSC